MRIKLRTGWDKRETISQEQNLRNIQQRSKSHFILNWNLTVTRPYYEFSFPLGSSIYMTDFIKNCQQDFEWSCWQTAKQCRWKHHLLGEGNNWCNIWETWCTSTVHGTQCPCAQLLKLYASMTTSICLRCRIECMMENDLLIFQSLSTKHLQSRLNRKKKNWM